MKCPVCAYPRPDIDGLGVGDRRERVVDGGRLRGHGQERGDTERYSSWNSVGVQPKAHPGDDDQHATRDVDCQEVI